MTRKSYTMDKLNNPDYSRAKNIHEFSVRNLKGEHIKLDNYKGFVCIMVNVDTKCPLNAQNYKHFNELMDKFGDSKRDLAHYATTTCRNLDRRTSDHDADVQTIAGLRILAFPCDQFGEDPGTPEEIASHAEKNNVKFDLFAKIDVNGEEASEVWKYLKHTLTGSTKHGNMIKSNYSKFIVNKVGIPVDRVGPEVDTDKFEKLLEPYL